MEGGAISAVVPSPEILPREAVKARTAPSGKHRVKFKPCIDIHQGKVKQIVGSTLMDVSSDRTSSGGSLVTNFESEFPSSFYAELYKHSKLPGGHIIMLGQDEASRRAAYLALLHFPGGMQLGGGVTLDNATEYLEAGASHVIVTSYVFRDGQLDEERLRKLVDLVGKEHLVLDLSCRKRGSSYYVVTDRWQKFSSLEVNQTTLQSLAASCDEFLVHGVDVEGKRLGIDEELVKILGKSSPIPVTYAGGARTLGLPFSCQNDFPVIQEDLERVKAAGNGHVDITIGSALDIFGGDLPFQAAVDWHRLQYNQ